MRRKQWLAHVGSRLFAFFLLVSAITGGWLVFKSTVVQKRGAPLEPTIMLGVILILIGWSMLIGLGRAVTRRRRRH